MSLNCLFYRTLKNFTEYIHKIYFYEFGLNHKNNETFQKKNVFRDEEKFLIIPSILGHHFPLGNILLQYPSDCHANTGIVSLVVNSTSPSGVV